ncbi:MAG: hypothetical protein HDS38_01890 [Bacteroides sp.]|nr:hypothetical protein [Bacteroides sp.]MBD5263005.1 hypothetical protein [Bacteroides sp.]
MEEIKRSNSDKVVVSEKEPPQFNGFTLDEIRHHRALIAVRKEFAKAKILEQLDAVKDRNPFAPDGSLKAAARLGSLPMKIMRGLNYTDYIMMGISAVGTARKVFSLFKKKKK